MSIEKGKAPQRVPSDEINHAHEDYSTRAYSLPRLKQMVADELLLDPALRDDDALLIERIYTKYFDTTGKTFTDVMVHHYEYELPSFESIRRCRQKLQHDYPEAYGSSKHTRKKRADLEAEYFAFALEG